MDNHEEETKHAVAQSRAEGANLTDKLAAYAWVEKYANGGVLCTDCRHSTQDGPGYAHICQVLEGEDRAHRKLCADDCPALPDDLSGSGA